MFVALKNLMSEIVLVVEYFTTDPLYNNFWLGHLQGNVHHKKVFAHLVLPDSVVEDCPLTVMHDP